MGTITIAMLVLVILSFLMGGSIASFLGVAAERPLRGESLNGRSRCICGRKLQWHENVPVFGWLKARGTAKCCGSKIPVRYVISETILGLLFAVFILLILFPYIENTTIVWLIIGVVGLIISSVLTFIILKSVSRSVK